MGANEYIAVVRDADKVIQEIACTRIDMNNVGGTQITGYIEGGSIGYETTLAVIPASFIVQLVDFSPYVPENTKTEKDV